MGVLSLGDELNSGGGVIWKDIVTDETDSSPKISHLVDTVVFYVLLLVWHVGQPYDLLFQMSPSYQPTHLAVSTINKNVFT